MFNLIFYLFIFLANGGTGQWIPVNRHDIDMIYGGTITTKKIDRAEFWNQTSVINKFIELGGLSTKKLIRNIKDRCDQTTCSQRTSTEAPEEITPFNGYYYTKIKSKAKDATDKCSKFNLIQPISPEDDINLIRLMKEYQTTKQFVSAKYVDYAIKYNQGAKKGVVLVDVGDIYVNLCTKTPNATTTTPTSGVSSSASPEDAVDKEAIGKCPTHFYLTTSTESPDILKVGHYTDPEEEIEFLCRYEDGEVEVSYDDHTRLMEQIENEWIEGKAVMKKFKDEMDNLDQHNSTEELAEHDLLKHNFAAMVIKNYRKTERMMERRIKRNEWKDMLKDLKKQTREGYKLTEDIRRGILQACMIFKDKDSYLITCNNPKSKAGTRYNFKAYPYTTLMGTYMLAIDHVEYSEEGTVCLTHVNGVTWFLGVECCKGIIANKDMMDNCPTTQIYAPPKITYHGDYHYIVESDAEVETNCADKRSVYEVGNKHRAGYYGACSVIVRNYFGDTEIEMNNKGTHIAVKDMVRQTDEMSSMEVALFTALITITVVLIIICCRNQESVICLIAAIHRASNLMNYRNCNGHTTAKPDTYIGRKMELRDTSLMAKDRSDPEQEKLRGDTPSREGEGPPPPYNEAHTNILVCNPNQKSPIPKNNKSHRKDGQIEKPKRKLIVTPL